MHANAVSEVSYENELLEKLFNAKKHLHMNYGKISVIQLMF